MSVKITRTKELWETQEEQEFLTKCSDTLDHPDKSPYRDDHHSSMTALFIGFLVEDEKATNCHSLLYQILVS